MAGKAKQSVKTKTATKKPKTTNTHVTKKAGDASSVSKIICIIIGVIAVVAIIFATVFAVKGAALNDAYFVSDDTKLVLNLDNDYDDDVVIAPVKSHLVYYYSGDSITGVKYYYEFSSNEKAAEAYNELKSNSDQEVGQFILNGKFIVFTLPSSQYEGTTVEDVKSYIKILESNDGTTEIEETITEEE